MVKCYYCQRQFVSPTARQQHIHAKHASVVLLMDEMLSFNIPHILSQFGNHIEIHALPEHLRGQPDHVIINYAKQSEMGMITADVECAHKAKLVLSPVFLVDQMYQLSQLN